MRNGGASLLYTRGRMFERFAKYIPVIAAAAAVAVALAVLSRVMVTVDTITHPEYRFAYLFGVAALLGGLALFVWLKLRRPRRPPVRRLPQHRRLAPEARLEAIYERHSLDEVKSAPADPVMARARARDTGRIRVVIAGVRCAGKTALAEALSEAAAAGSGHHPLDVELVELEGLDTNRGRNLERLAAAQTADLALFVVDQDLRDYEQAALSALARRGARLLVVLNKSDLMRTDALAETRQAIAAKLASSAIAADIVNSAAAPRPHVRMREGGGAEEVARPPEVSAILGQFESLASRHGRTGVRILAAAP
jgi:chloramphenicol 3-O-phosphotransferase